MKKIVYLLVSLLLISLLCTLPAGAAGSVAASADRSTVTIGSTVTITLKYDGGNTGIGSLDATLSYNAKTFQYVSCTGATANGQAGVVSISYFATEAVSPKALTITLTFKAIAAGDGNFSLKTDGMWDDSDNLLGNPSKTLSVSAINPTKSGNANLASLKPSKGTLTPKFSASTTNYTITVPYTVTSLTLSATTSHEDAKTSISGKNALEVGKNTRVITVTAPNGTTKKYTVVITRSPNQNATTGSNQNTDTGTTTTLPQPAEDALEVEVDGKLMVVPEVQPTVDLPDGYRWNTVAINEVDVPAAKNEQSGIVLLYLTEKDAATSAFYIYDATAGAFSAFRPFAVSGGTFVLHDLPDSETGPAGTIPGTLHYEGGSVSAFVYEDADQADFSIVYATSPAGVTGLYVYDRTDGSLQRYREVQQPADEAPTDTTQQPTGGFLAFLTTHKTVILLGAAVCGGLALLIGAVVLLINLLHRPRNFKH